jgi:dynein heavy chain
LLPYYFLGFDERLNSLKERLELIHAALKSYLETKRHIFPRFYFMSNSDILEVLGQSKRPENVQPHLKKCFDNINKIKVVKVGRISPYSIYWRQSLNINKDKGM